MCVWGVSGWLNDLGHGTSSEHVDSLSVARWKAGVCGTNTTASSTSADLGSYTDLLEEGNDSFVLSFLRMVERCLTILRSNGEITCKEERLYERLCY